MTSLISAIAQIALLFLKYFFDPVNAQGRQEKKIENHIQEIRKNFDNPEQLASVLADQHDRVQVALRGSAGR